MTKHLSLAGRLWLVSILSLGLFTATVVAGWLGLGASRDALKTVYLDRALPMHDLALIQRHIDANYAHVLTAFQHDPAGPLNHVHDHKVSLHTDAIRATKADIDALWAAYMQTYLTEEEKLLAADFAVKRRVWVDRIMRAVAAVEGATTAPG